jgi:hypothetical protein
VETSSVDRVYRVPEDFDTSVFVGAHIERVCFGAYVVQLDFGSEQRLHIRVEGAYVHAGPEHEGWADEVRLPTNASRLMQLTNHVVVEAARLDAQRLRLAFDHGHALTLIDDTDEYESFQIEARGRLWVI